MPSNHQILRYTQRTATLGSVISGSMGIEVPPSLIFRRMFLAAHWWTGMQNILWTARVEFMNQGKSDGYPLDFGWRSMSYGIPSGAIGYSLTPEFPICPPYSVETIPNGSAADFPSAAQAQSDEMIATTRDMEMSMVRNVRMLPIPLVVRCDQIRASYKFYTDATTSAFPAFEMFLGCRSSDYAL